MEENAPSSSGKESANPYIIPGAIILAGLLIAGSLVYSNTKKSFPPNGTTPAQNTPAPQDLFDASDPSLGSPGAPVTLVEFSDFQCPYCERFFQETEPRIIEQYVKTGKVRFIYRDFAFLGQESQDAGQAAECANAQGKFWQYHDYLFQHQNGENQGAFTPDNLKQFARILGLDGSPFDSCLDNGTYASEVSQDVADGRRFDVSGTPTVFINGEKIVGALPFETYQASIEKVLKSAP